MASICLPMGLMALLIPASLVNCVSEVDCPDNTYHIGDRSCIHVRQSRNSREYERIRKNNSEAEKFCKRLTIGDLKWNLPKLNSKKKVIETARILIQQMESEPHPHQHHHDPYRHKDRGHLPWIWLGLRRRPNKTDETDETAWYWIDDNKTMTLKYSHGDFWMRDEPKNEFGNDFCAVAFILRNETKPEERLQFAAMFCEKPADTHNGLVTEQPADMFGYACTADVPTDITDEWWFYVICALLVMVPVLALTVVLIVYCCKRTKTDRPRPTSRKAIIDQRSVTGEQYSTGSFGEKSDVIYVRPKVGYVPPPTFYAPSNSGHEETGDGSRYQNVPAESMTKNTTTFVRSQSKIGRLSANPAGKGAVSRRW